MVGFLNGGTSEVLLNIMEERSQRVRMKEGAFDVVHSLA
jgi:hypothetical protein